jgi:hypothetical protein
MSGKNYSRGNSDKRKESDFYETPYSLTEELLKADDDWDFSRLIKDPCCGNGAIVKVLNKYFDTVLSSDLSDGTDFLADNTCVTYLITNPPYSIANECVIHAKEVVTCKFAMLLPLTYLQGSYRYNNIWMDEVFPLRKAWVLNRYPMLGDPLRDDGKFRTGMQSYIWAIWDKHYKGHPELGWIDVDKYVLKKGE